MPLRTTHVARARARVPVVLTRVLITLVPLLLALCMCGCVRREGRNSDCTWPGEVGATVLDPKQPAAARHLSADTEFAEELADRYTNVHYGPRSGHVGPPTASVARHQCMAKLFEEIGRTHGAHTDQVVASFGRNRVGIDAAEILSFTVLFAWTVMVIVRRIWARYPPSDGWTAGILIVLLCSLGFGVAAVLIGPVWSMTAENIRIGTGHLGPRVARLPMERYPKAVFAVGVFLFWVIAVICRLPVKNENRARA